MSPCLLIAAAGLAMGVAFGAPLRGQERPAPYSELTLRAAGVVNTNRERLHRYWAPAPGARVEVETPVAFGSFAAGATRIPFRLREAPHVDCDATFLSLEWRVPVAVAGPFRVAAGVRAGDLVQVFRNDPNPLEGLTQEQELFYGVAAHLRATLSPRLALDVSGAVIRVHSRVPFRLALVSAGLAYTLDTPAWLRAILE